MNADAPGERCPLEPPAQQGGVEEPATASNAHAGEVGRRIDVGSNLIGIEHDCGFAELDMERGGRA